MYALTFASFVEKHRLPNAPEFLEACFLLVAGGASSAHRLNQTENKSCE
jgi:hypothetical protein